MKKELLLLGVCSALINNASAQEAVLSLTGDNVVEISSQNLPEKNSASTESSDDKGVFSFLNFWQKDKKIPENNMVSTAPKETQLQQLTRLADAGDLNSQLTLGYMYLYGDESTHVDQNYDKAFHYYELAAAQKDNVAINNLGSLYYSGIGTPRNVLKAVQMFTQAAELGNAESMVNLAFIYISGQGDLYQPQEAIRLFEKASAAQNPTADFMLGYAYYKGYIVPKNYRQAFELIKRAASAGYDDAMLVLSSMYMEGQGTPQNYGNGVKVLNMAVAQGNVPAMMQLGYILANGEKYPKNIYKAHILFNVASVKGAEGAQERREILRSMMKIEELLQAQAEAEAYKEKPSELTVYIRQTFGDNIKKYIDDAISSSTTKKKIK